MYGMLPSMVREQATTYDMLVTDVMLAWENQKIEEYKTGVKAVPKLSEQEMQAMLDKVKKIKKGV
jgi:hypothetical protein